MVIGLKAIPEYAERPAIARGDFTPQDGAANSEYNQAASPRLACRSFMVNAKIAVKRKQIKRLTEKKALSLSAASTIQIYQKRPASAPDERAAQRVWVICEQQFDSICLHNSGL